MLLMCAFLAASYTDLTRHEIPLWLFPGTLLIHICVGLAAMRPPGMGSLLGAAAMALPCAILCMAGSLGGGDLIMFTAAGFIIGIWRLAYYGVALSVSVAITAAIYAARLMIRFHKIPEGTEFPFAPAAAAAYALMLAFWK